MLELHAVSRELPGEAGNRLRAWLDGRGDAQVYALGVPGLGRATLPRYLLVAGLLLLVGLVIAGLGMAIDAFPKQVTLVGGLLGLLGLAIGAVTIFGWFFTGGLQGLVRFTAARTPFFLWHDDAYLFTWQPTRNPQLRCYAWRDIASLTCHVTRPAMGQSRAYPLLDVHIRDRTGVTHEERWEVLMDADEVQAWCPKLRAASAEYQGEQTNGNQG